MALSEQEKQDVRKGYDRYRDDGEKAFDKFHPLHPKVRPVEYFDYCRMYRGLCERKANAPKEPTTRRNPDRNYALHMNPDIIRQNRY